jgi:hypothetical protein
MTPEERAAYRLAAMRAEALEVLGSLFVVDTFPDRVAGQGEWAEDRIPVADLPQENLRRAQDRKRLRPP